MKVETAFEKKSLILTVLIVTLASIASLTGIIYTDIYRDNEFVNQVWLGNDIVTIGLGIPLLIISLILRKSRIKFRFVWIGCLWYMIYNYIFYIYGATFNKLFLVHTAIVILSIYAFIILLISLDYKYLRNFLKENTSIPFRRVSLYLMLFGISIGSLWIIMSFQFIATDVVPIGITQTGHKSGIIFATDLVFLISHLIVGAVLLWKKSVWGFIISSTLCVKGCLYPVVLALGGYLAYRKTGIYDPLTPGYIIFGLGCFICLLLLLKDIKTKLED